MIALETSPWHQNCYAFIIRHAIGAAMKTWKPIRFSCILIGCVISPASAQGDKSLDHNLSLLRGIWETHTYRTKFTINFLSDTKMAYDKHLADYQLGPTTLRIHADDGELSYTYEIQNNRLVLTSGTGTSINLKREGFGGNEQKLSGKYFSGFDSTGCEELLSFNEDATFAYSKECKTSDMDAKKRTEKSTLADLKRSEGVFRVENAFIVLAFNRGSVREAVVRYQDSNEDVTGIVLDGKLFDKEFQVHEPIVGYRDPCFDCFPPPPPPPPPHPPGPDCPPPPPEPVRPHRDTGPTRGDSGSNLPDGGSRPGGRRP